jgi:transcription initiation factor TFIIB
MSFAGSVLYLASLYTSENKTQADFACAAGLTVVTIRNRYRDLKIWATAAALTNSLKRGKII